MSEITSNSSEVDSNICTVVVKQQKYKISSKLLEKVSPVFERMLNADFKEKATRLITLHDVTPNTFELILDYIRGNVKNYRNCGVDIVIDMVYFANKYLMKELEMKLCDHLASIPIEENDILFRLYGMASKLQIRNLLAHCIRMLASRFIEFLPIHAEVIYECGVTDFITLMETLAMREMQRYQMIAFYIIKNLSNYNEHETDVKRLLDCVKYEQMTAMEYINGPGASKFLPIDKKYHTLCKMIQTEHKKKFRQRNFK